jgi:hypothetical protein
MAQLRYIQIGRWWEKEGREEGILHEETSRDWR